MKVNGNCIYKGKFQKRYLVWIDMHRQQTTETQEKQTVLIRCPTYSQKLKYVYDFATHYQQHFNSTTTHTDLFKCITFKVVKFINTVGYVKTFTKPILNTDDPIVG